MSIISIFSLWPSKTYHLHCKCICSHQPSAVSHVRILWFCRDGMVNHSMLQKRVESWWLPWWILVKVICESLLWCLKSEFERSHGGMAMSMPSDAICASSMTCELAKHDCRNPIWSTWTFKGLSVKLLTYVDICWHMLRNSGERGWCGRFSRSELDSFLSPSTSVDSADEVRLSALSALCDARCAALRTARCALRLSPFVHEVQDSSSLQRPRPLSALGHSSKELGCLSLSKVELTLDSQER